MPGKAERYRKPYHDDELIVILSDAPTKANTVKHAARFQRTPGAIEQIYRWAMTPPSQVNARGRENDKFQRQIRRIAKKRLGWLS